MAFVKYTERGRGSAPTISLSPGGNIAFSEGALRRFGLFDKPYVVLYYDADTQRVGIEPTTDASAEGARKLSKRNTGAVVSGRGFMDHFGISVEKTTSCILTQDRKSGMVVADLTTGKKRR
ncbi:MAG TPA: hypothetical protein VLH79_04610 [Chthonomonadales bacterium]|nr:hypothetical protein [Chthonomonadales bacterium]